MSTSHRRLKRLIRIPFGLENTLPIFERATDAIFASVHWKYTLDYVHDIFVLSTSLADHIEQVQGTLRLLYDSGVTHKLKKCEFFGETIDCLGHNIQTVPLELAEHTTDATAKLERPNTRTILRCFVGLCNVFRWIVPIFTRLAVPLNKT